MKITTDDYAKLLLRIALGAILFAHGALKLFVFTPAGTVGFFASLGLPAVAAYMTIVGELALGALLILGVATRLSALLSVTILSGATWVHIDNGWLFSNQGGGWEFPAMLVLVAVVVAILGAGRFALWNGQRIESGRLGVVLS